VGNLLRRKGGRHNAAIRPPPDPAEDNPILLRLKELEALEKVSEKVGNVVVTNGLDGVLEDLVRIGPKRA
jgi:hypothetical protein